VGRSRPAELVAQLVRLHRGVQALIERGSPRFGDGDDSTLFGSDPRPPLLHALSMSSAVLDLSEVPGDSAAAGILRTHTNRRGAAEAESHRIALEAPISDSELALQSWIATVRSGPAICTLRSGSLGYLPVAAHAHADLTSLVLSIDGAPLIVDPGTYCYDSHPAWRRHLRSSAAHNCMVLDATDQAEYWGPFLWGTDATAQVSSYLAGQRSSKATITHDGYRRLGYNTVRSVEGTIGSLVVSDSIVAADRGTTAAASIGAAQVTFTFAPGVVLQPTDRVDTFRRLVSGTGQRLRKGKCTRTWMDVACVRRAPISGLTRQPRPGSSDRNGHSPLQLGVKQAAASGPEKAEHW
jgi:hypothetical protein